MAKKAVKAANEGIIDALTAAQSRAQIIAKMRQSIKEETEKLEALEQEQIAYMRKENLTEFEGLKLVETAGRVKWAGATGKTLDLAKERLMSLLDPIFIKKSINESKLFAAVDSDLAVKGALATVGVSLEKAETGVSLRTAK